MVFESVWRWCSGVWRCVVVCGGVWRRVVGCSGVWRCVVVSGGGVVVCGGVWRWCSGEVGWVGEGGGNRRVSSNPCQPVHQLVHQLTHQS